MCYFLLLCFGYRISSVSPAKQLSLHSWFRKFIVMVSIGFCGFHSNCGSAVTFKLQVFFSSQPGHLSDYNECIIFSCSCWQAMHGFPILPTALHVETMITFMDKVGCIGNKQGCLWMEPGATALRSKHSPGHIPNEGWETVCCWAWIPSFSRFICRC